MEFSFKEMAAYPGSPGLHKHHLLEDTSTWESFCASVESLWVHVRMFLRPFPSGPLPWPWWCTLQPSSPQACQWCSWLWGRARCCEGLAAEGCLMAPIPWCGASQHVPCSWPFAASQELLFDKGLHQDLCKCPHQLYQGTSSWQDFDVPKLSNRLKEQAFIFQKLTMFYFYTQQSSFSSRAQQANAEQSN